MDSYNNTDEVTQPRAVVHYFVWSEANPQIIESQLDNLYITQKMGIIMINCLGNKMVTQSTFYGLNNEQ